jgi:hypothetical protein
VAPFSGKAHAELGDRIDRVEEEIVTSVVAGLHQLIG